MLNGLQPILIFHFSAVSPETAKDIASIPIVSSVVDLIGLPPIPIYMDDKITGLFIQSEDKNVDIGTAAESTRTGAVDINQKAINSTIRINMTANKGSIGVTLLSALCDIIFAKVTSKEYSITYLHGAVTVFNGLLHSFAINQNSNDTLYNITLELTKGATEKPKPVEAVAPAKEPLTLKGGLDAPPPTSTLTPPVQGPPPQPPSPAPVPMQRLG